VASARGGRVIGHRRQPTHLLESYFFHFFQTRERKKVYLQICNLTPRLSKIDIRKFVEYYYHYYYHHHYYYYYYYYNNNNNKIIIIIMLLLLSSSQALVTTL